MKHRSNIERQVVQLLDRLRTCVDDGLYFEERRLKDQLEDLKERHPYLEWDRLEEEAQQ